MADTTLPAARRLVRCPDCTGLHPEDPASACPARQVLTGELARVNLSRLTNRQWSGIDCTLCGLWLCTPADTATRPLGQALNFHGRRYTLWAHAPNC